MKIDEELSNIEEAIPKSSKRCSHLLVGTTRGENHHWRIDREGQVLRKLEGRKLTILLLVDPFEVIILKDHCDNSAEGHECKVFAFASMLSRPKEVPQIFVGPNCF